MSRSGYNDDCDDIWAWIRWRGALKQTIRGSRGQSVLRELIQALDALPDKRLAFGSLVTPNGDYCALGALGRARGMDMVSIDPDDTRAVADAFGMTISLAAEIIYQNDDEAASVKYTSKTRWSRVRAWAVRNLK